MGTFFRTFIAAWLVLSQKTSKFSRSEASINLAQGRYYLRSHELGRVVVAAFVWYKVGINLRSFELGRVLACLLPLVQGWYYLRSHELTW